MRKSITILVGVLAVAALAQRASALTVNPVIKDIGGTPASNLSVQDPFSAARVSFQDNAVEKISIGGSTADGGVSITLAVSNGENGMNVGAGSGPGGIGANNDLVNMTPVGTAIDIVNGGNGTQGHRIQNGNAFRFSLWMQQVPGDPITQAISVEPVLKFELFSEAQSVFADYDGRKPTAAFGDRLWDTDLNATDPIFEGQSVASHVDIDGDNAVVTGDVPVASLPEATGVQWVRVETTIVIDDDPDGTGFGWDIAGQAFDVSAIEEVRGTFFIGDFTGTVLGAGRQHLHRQCVAGGFPGRSNDAGDSESESHADRGPGWRLQRRWLGRRGRLHRVARQSRRPGIGAQESFAWRDRICEGGGLHSLEDKFRSRQRRRRAIGGHRRLRARPIGTRTGNDRVVFFGECWGRVHQTPPPLAHGLKGAAGRAPSTSNGARLLAGFIA